MAARGHAERPEGALTNRVVGTELYPPQPAGEVLEVIVCMTVPSGQLRDSKDVRRESPLFLPVALGLSNTAVTEMRPDSRCGLFFFGSKDPNRSPFIRTASVHQG